MINKKNFTIFQILQVLIGISAFVNKVLLIQRIRVGWLIGALATLLAIYYFLILHFYVYAVVEVGLTILMVYGYFFETHKKQLMEYLINGVTLLFMILICFFTSTGFMSVLELVGAISMIAGAYTFTHERRGFGWGLYLITHLVTAYLCYPKQQQFFGDMQIASALVAGVGLWQTCKTT